VFLYFACAALIVAEVFVPSGGLITLCAIGCLAGGIVIFFNHSPAVGWTGVLIAVVMIPSVLVMAYKVFPNTRFGKQVLLSPPRRKEGEAIPDAEELKGLLGAVGTVITTMRPVGMCDFSDKRLECVAESGYVEKGRQVKVIRVESTQVMVRVVETS
jgi:membrane-bound serine protease (ClpP class)